MLYTYGCSECNYEEDFDYGMLEDKPKRKKCPKCEKLSMSRVWNNSAIAIPDSFKATMPKLDKSPSGRKHFY